MLVAFAVLLGVLHPSRTEVFVPALRTSVVTCAVAIAVVVPLTVYVATHAPRSGDAQWEDTLVFVMALIASVVVAALGGPGRRIPAWTSAVALGGFGIASALGPSDSASWGCVGHRSLRRGDDADRHHRAADASPALSEISAR